MSKDFVDEYYPDDQIVDIMRLANNTEARIGKV